MIKLMRLKNNLGGQSDIFCSLEAKYKTCDSGGKMYLTKNKMIENLKTKDKLALLLGNFGRPISRMKNIEIF